MEVVRADGYDIVQSKHSKIVTAAMLAWMLQCIQKKDCVEVVTTHGVKAIVPQR